MRTCAPLPPHPALALASHLAFVIPSSPGAPLLSHSHASPNRSPTPVPTHLSFSLCASPPLLTLFCHSPRVACLIGFRPHPLL
ncbi:hypothetical protein CPC08DRAFT_771344, partial [Agrocybe pediades]